MSVERISLIRHGRTAWNVEGRWQGIMSVPLDEVGRAQAQALAAWWKEPLSAIWTSDLDRALDTATALGDALGIVPRVDTRLRECNLGIFQGLTTAEMQARYPDEYAQLRADYFGYCVPNGESRRQLQERVYAAFADIASTSDGHVAIVTHGAALQVLMWRILENPPPREAAHYGNTSITTVEPDGDGWRLVALAETPHLAPAADDAATLSEQMGAKRE